MASSENRRHDSKSSAGFTRREFLPMLGATTALAALGPRALAAASDQSAKIKPSEAQARFVYVGTYTAPGTPPGGTDPRPPPFPPPRFACRRPAELLPPMRPISAMCCRLALTRSPPFRPARRAF